MIYSKAPNSDECLCVKPWLNVYAHVLAIFLMQLNEIYTRFSKDDAMKASTAHRILQPTLPRLD